MPLVFSIFVATACFSYRGTAARDVRHPLTRFEHRLCQRHDWTLQLSLEQAEVIVKFDH